MYPQRTSYRSVALIPKIGTSWSSYMRKGGLKNEETTQFKVGGLSTPGVPPIAYHERERVKIHSRVLKAWFRCDGKRIIAGAKDQAKKSFRKRFSFPTLKTRENWSVIIIYIFFSISIEYLNTV